VDDAARGSAARELDQALRADDARREGGVGIVLVMDGRRRAREVEDDLRVDVQWIAHVTRLEVEVRIARRVREVDEVARHQVVEADDLVPFGEQAIDQV